jgi:hypothetical protein
VQKVIDRSDYSDENKGNYKGSLITRLESLTTGVYGMVFVDDDLSNADLFDKNVIVDLSRVGSMETKALIMGLLVMKLQEYRMTSGTMNADLQHITVLEEAHNLLKRTSTEQSGESANLLGKSVEMLANAVAEMRTYGEGFIIADQSPGLLDMSVIRNTNTKIVLRLPDESDRELVGKAAGLNDDQIVELAKLQQGVAAIYQNDWIQPILCKVDYFPVKKDKDGKDVVYRKPDEKVLQKLATVGTLTDIAFSSGKVTDLKEKIDRVDFADFKALPVETILNLFPNSRRVFREALQTATDQKTRLSGLKEYIVDRVEPSLKTLSQEHQNHILNCIVEECCKTDENLRSVPEQWREFTKGGVYA